MESRAAAFTAALSRFNRVLQAKCTSLQNTTDLTRMNSDIERQALEMTLAAESLTIEHGSGGQDWPMLRDPGAPIPRVWKALQSEYKTCASSFACFVAAATTEIQRLEPCINAEGGPPTHLASNPITKHGMYTSLISFSCNASYCLSMLWRNLSALSTTDVQGLQGRLLGFMTCQLRMLRNPQHITHRLLRCLWGPAWHTQLRMLLGPPLSSLMAVRRLQKHEMVRAVPTLVPGLVSTLSCLTVELLGKDLLQEQTPGSQHNQHLLRDSGTANFLSTLADVVYCFTSIFDGQVSVAIFRSVSVIQLGTSVLVKRDHKSVDTARAFSIQVPMITSQVPTSVTKPL